jgi:hypothetical protein
VQQSLSYLKAAMRLLPLVYLTQAVDQVAVYLLELVRCFLEAAVVIDCPRG